MADSPSRPWGPWAIAVSVTAVGFAVAWWFIPPPPPDSFVVATGRPDGAYHRFAMQYKNVLAEQGIRLEVRATQGSVENYRLLAEDPDVDVAIVQGGTGPERGDFLTLTGLYNEPVWVFVRGDEAGDLRELRGKRIAVGSAESGTRAAAVTFLGANGLTEDEATFVDASGPEAVADLRNDRVDAVFLVLAVGDPLIESLLADEAITQLPFPRNEAYRRRFTYISAVTLPRGVVDLDRDLPREDRPMVASVAQLVASPDLHPAFVPLLLEAVRRVHDRGDLLTEPGTFPSTEHATHPVSPAAERWFLSGPSFLYRWLPFSVASMVDRAKILLLPALTLLLPLVKVAPPLIRWRIRSSIYKWYRVLRTVDEHLHDEPGEPELHGHLETLATLRAELESVSVPLSYMEEFYNLRMHLDLVRDDVERRLRETADPTAEERTGDPPPRGPAPPPHRVDASSTSDAYRTNDVEQE